MAISRLAFFCNERFMLTHSWMQGEDSTDGYSEKYILRPYIVRSAGALLAIDTTASRTRTGSVLFITSMI